MGKSKPSKQSATPVVATPKLNGVKDGRVAKASQTPKSKAQDLAKTVATKKDFAKKIDEDEDDDSEDSVSEEDSEDSSEEDSDEDEEDDGSEDEAPKPKA